MQGTMKRIRTEYVAACLALFNLPTAVKALLTVLLCVPAVALILLDRLNTLEAMSLSAMGGMFSLAPKLPISQPALSEMQNANALLHAGHSQLTLVLIVAACVGVYLIVGMWFTFGIFRKRAAA